MKANKTRCYTRLATKNVRRIIEKTINRYHEVSNQRTLGVEIDFFGGCSLKEPSILKALVDKARKQSSSKFLSKLQDISPLDLYFGPRNIRVRNGRIFPLLLARSIELKRMQFEKGSLSVSIAFYKE